MKTISLLLLTLSVIIIAPNAVAQSVRSDNFNRRVTSSSQDLRGVEPRNAADWNWAVGGEYPQQGASLPLDSASLNLDAYQAGLDNLNLTLEQSDRQLGDTQRPTYRVPVASF